MGDTDVDLYGDDLPEDTGIIICLFFARISAIVNLSPQLNTIFPLQGNDGNQNGAEDLYDDVLTTPAVPESAPDVKPQQAPQLMQQSIVPPSVSAVSPAPPPHQSSPSVHHGQPNSGKRYSLYVG